MTQVVKFHQKSPAHQLQMSVQGRHLRHKGLRELKKLWRTKECPLLFVALSITLLLKNYLFCLLALSHV